MIVDDEVEALSDTQRAMLRASAEAGDPDAQHELGARLSRGEGIDASPTEGARWLALAASQGHAEAQFRLSRSYAQGRGVPKDNGQLLRWLSEAANQNHASARVQMGIHLIRGELVPKDFVRAVELLSRPHIESSRWCRARRFRGSSSTGGRA